ncbi:MAG: lipopolysaccharide kinase InaA family protein [Desulfosalsimonas sp.]
MTLVQYHRGLKFGSPGGLSVSQMDRLILSFHEPARKTQGVLRGRTQVRTAELEGTGPVIIKPYFRGGMLRHINKKTYLALGKTRSRAEFEILQHVRQIGINAPEPLVFAVQGRFFYRAWLVTGQIPGAAPLSELCLSEPERARRVLPGVVRQIEVLIHKGILHVDLHPGNVLVDRRERAWLIDFDRAETGVKDKRRLRQRLVKRWIRAADKYGLPGFVRNAIEAAGPE